MRTRYFLRRGLVVLLVLALVAAIAAGGYLAGKALFGNGDTESTTSAPAPRVVVRKTKEQSTSDLGFPAFATRNTTRVGGVDPIDDAAGAALAANPSSGTSQSPAAVSLVPADSWQDGIAAASLTAQPVGAPVLIGAPGSVPAITAQALGQLAPRGSAATKRAQLFAIGGVEAPNGLKTMSVGGSDPATVAANVARLRTRLAGAKPQHIVVASSADASYAMPAAAWAARSGDPVLFAGAGPPPVATLKALRQYAGVPVYVLGPPAAVSNRAFNIIRKVAPTAKRVGGADPVANSIDFARYVDGSFGWNINDPGHGLVIASVARPLDAGASAALSATGSWGPLLVTTDGAAVPPALHSYLLDLKPGYVSDPTRAVYNHIWLIGDAGAISVSFQADVDELAELVKVRSGAG